VRVALYARVSSEAQEAKGTIGSQLEVLRARVAAEKQELVAEYLDDGYSGARLDRPGLDALRDAAEAGLIEAVWCLSPDRLARAYAYQVVILDELERFGVRVLFVDTPPLDDPQARLLTQVQGVIAEYERAKIAERNRRGKLYRSRAGEIVSWKAPYGYRVVPRSAASPARLEIYEPEAVVVRRIFDDYVAGGRSIRQITLALNIDGVPTATGKSEWAPAVVGRFLRNEAYVGRAYYNRTMWSSTQSGRRSQQRGIRPKEEWIPIAVPTIITDDVFEAAQRVSRDNTKFSPRRLTDEAWLLRGLVICGSCGVHASCQRLRGTYRGNDRAFRYYHCPNHDRLRAGGEARRCPERHIRADEFDAFVFDQVRSALLQPDILVAGQTALANKGPVPDDELLAVELARLDRKIEAADTERRRLADLYQAGLLELPEIQRRSRDIAARRQALASQHDHLVADRNELVTHNRLRNRVDDFASRVSKGIDKLDFNHRQQLMRLVVDHVTVTGWQVEIHLRITLDGHTTATERKPRRRRKPAPKSEVSSDDGLRLLRGVTGGVGQAVADHRMFRRMRTRAAAGAGPGQDRMQREHHPPSGGVLESGDAGTGGLVHQPRRALTVVRNRLTARPATAPTPHAAAPRRASPPPARTLHRPSVISGLACQPPPAQAGKTLNPPKAPPATTAQEIHPGRYPSPRHADQALPITATTNAATATASIAPASVRIGPRGTLERKVTVKRGGEPVLSVTGSFHCGATGHP
jgi:site-specific DNA recombinase